MKNTNKTIDRDNTEKRKYGWKAFLLPVILIVCLFSVISASAFGLMIRTKSAVHENIQKKLFVNAQMIDQKIESLFNSIEAMTSVMCYESGNSQEQMIQNMNSLREACGFDFVVRTDTNGKAINYLGKDNIDLSDREYIKTALSGKPAIEVVDTGAYDTKNSYVIMAVPIFFDGNVVGVFHGSYKTSNFVDMMDQLVSELGNDCDEVGIISNDGAIIASNHDSFDAETVSILSEKIKNKDSLHIENNFQTLKSDGILHYFYYTNLNTGVDNGWYIVARMSPDYLNEQMAFVRICAISQIVISVFITIALLYIVIKKQKLTDEVNKRSALLSDALDAAESAGRAKSRFLSTVSHEMRTPLNAIIGFVELSKGADEQQKEKYLQNMEISSKQLLSVINDVLDMSSIEAGRMLINKEPFDFRQLIQSITNIFVSQCHDKGLEYNTKLLTPIDEWLIGDQLRLNQILINLLSNAVKFTSSGQIWLSISQRNVKDNIVFLHFEVSDTGCGMTEDVQQRLFKPFEQGDSHIARKYGGTGLGLSIVKNLTSLMGGAVSMRSKPGEGSTFFIDLPFEKSKETHSICVPKGIDSLHILVVDDEPMEREYISTVLTRMNARFSCVESCDIALAALREATEQGCPFNICLVDWKMPNADGAETTRRIREKYGSNVVVIVVSAYDHNKANDSAKKAGANIFIPKPLFQSSLFDLFMTLTGGEFVRMKEPAHIYDFSGKRVLLAEDNEMNQIVTEGLLKKLGANCDIAENGKIAVDLFLDSAHGYYDLILMDVQMPIMDGLEATRKIRQSAHPDSKTIQILALSANAFNEDVAQALSSGMNAHVSKPIEIDEFARTLDKAFRAQE